MSGRIAVVTGANRGIGREVARQLAAAGDTVILTSRDPARTESTVRKLADADGAATLTAHQLDVTDPSSAAALSQFLAERFGRLDVLVNNAAIHYDTFQQATSADLRIVREALDTNPLGAWHTAQALLPLLRKSEHGRIVNVSSEAGSLTSMAGGTPAYRTSKTALNALTRMLAAELRSVRILVNAVCPGPADRPRQRSR